MGDENTPKKKLSRARGRPRVDISHDIVVGDHFEQRLLPFVVGVLADISGQPKQALRPLRERKPVVIDRDNFNDVLARFSPRLGFRVPNRLGAEEDSLVVELCFHHFDDFEPGGVAVQIDPLRQILDKRKQLCWLNCRMDNTGRLEQLLEMALERCQQGTLAATEQELIARLEQLLPPARVQPRRGP